MDIAVHIMTSAGIFLLLREFLDTRKAILITFLSGVFKEQVLDVYTLLKDFSMMDMVGNVIGIFLGYLLDRIWTKQ
jgi:predicted lysophospholipase L1 biosynthesis ABC-type transport system permease subunit